jgi:hypothetical protein
MKPIPLFGYGVAGKSLPVTAQRRVNCYYEIHEDGDKQQICIFGTPGLTLFSNLTTANGPVRGMHNFVAKDLLFAVVGNILYSINPAGQATNIGSVTPGTGLVAMEDNGIQLIILDGTQGWTYNVNTSTFAAITSPNFPQNARTVCYDSTFFIVDNNSYGNGYFAVSNSFDGTTWQALSVGNMYSSSNPLLRCYALAGLVILQGSYSTEFWQDVGASPQPYAPQKGATQPYGLAAIASTAPLDNTIAFLAQNQTGRLSIMSLDGYTCVRISTPDIDNIINGFAITSDAVAFGYVTDGHPMYQITFQNAQRTFLYDNTTNLWSEVQTGVGLTGRHLCNVGCGFNGAFYCGDYTQGNIYLLDPNAYTDNGNTIPRILQSRHIFEDYNILGLDELYLALETGVGLQSGQGSNPQMVLQVSKNGGRTFGTERWAQIGKVGQYKDHRAVWRRLGSGRDFTFRFTMTDPVKFSIIGGAVTPRPGTDGQHSSAERAS